MRIILTHEQADFDALASLFGAHLLDEGTIPVLPRRINRNVRAFLVIYGAEFPLIDPRDLPNEPVEAVTLVDTQSIVSIKGMNEQTRVHVIDHHLLRDDLPLKWMITVSGTGANTTMIVERLQESDIVLSTVQATLLLMGIYEDTGSLTYHRTTSRDLRAASYLLEQGASLQIAADFLNHPLSDAQQILYDQLRENTTPVNIHGQTVMIAVADAGELDEEFSTVAHKLRDLIDPDALFVLVVTRGGVQLIARSTSPNIDVADIAAHFGGGGHERAAAGLIREGGLDDVREELLRILPDHIHPAVTVAQLMSHNPQLLSPDTTVEDAAERMQRFGYEGYPVVSDGKILGLLTRRSVDRAIAHNLPTTAGSLMEAGDFSVAPNDSIDHLQRIMTDSGWGQIPVVLPETGAIIGIVTRTDLIHSLAPEPRFAGRQNLSQRLEIVLPPARLKLLKAVSQTAHEQHAALYIVGGFVRDLILERPSLDFDLVVEGDAIELAKTLAKEYGGRVTSHSRFGTAKWYMYEGIHPEKEKSEELVRLIAPHPISELPEFLDFVTARTEFYSHPTALPTVERGSIKLDLHRRDFTINTLAVRLDGHHFGELHDYWGGLMDLRRGLVRVLHSLSFVDDPTRMLRAVRFEQRFEFKIENRTLELLEEAVSLLDRVSSDRVRHELDHILIEDRCALMLARLKELELLGAINPSIQWDDWLKTKIQQIVRIKAESGWGFEPNTDELELRKELAYILLFIRLSASQLKRVLSRLKFSARLGHTITAARRLFKDLSELEQLAPSGVVYRLEEVPPLAIFAVYVASDEQNQKEVLEKYMQVWKEVQPNISGHDLRKRGIPPGPDYRTILVSLRNGWLDGDITTVEQETAMLERLIQQSGGNS